MHAKVAYAEPMTGMKARIAAALELLGRFPLAVLQLMARLALAGVFFKAGLNKYQSWEFTVQLFADEYKVPVLSPEIAAQLATTTELGCSTLLVLGLLARLATLPLLGQILVIQLFVYPNAWPEHLTWASLLLLVLTRGAGSISLDRLIGLESSEPQGR